ncbi:hypothetical protein J6590_052813 [Homalodisca vitripennis]|nr:hypothetical protein J6590_052813 [Homalodisca vitripennis]
MFGGSICQDYRLSISTKTEHLCTTERSVEYFYNTLDSQKRVPGGRGEYPVGGIQLFEPIGSLHRSNRELRYPKTEVLNNSKEGILYKKCTVYYLQSLIKLLYVLNLYIKLLNPAVKKNIVPRNPGLFNENWKIYRRDNKTV